jgi:hypothetical protein
MPIQSSDYIIGTIIFTLLALGMIGIFAEVQSNNSNFVDGQEYSTFNKSFNHYDELTTSVNGLQTSITGSKIDNSIFGVTNGVINSLIGTVWTTLKFLFNSFSFMGDAFNGLVTLLGLPAWLPILLGLIVIVIIAFGIFAAITRTTL